MRRERQREREREREPRCEAGFVFIFLERFLLEAYAQLVQVVVAILSPNYL